MEKDLLTLIIEDYDKSYVEAVEKVILALGGKYIGSHSKGNEKYYAIEKDGYNTLKKLSSLESFGDVLDVYKDFQPKKIFQIQLESLEYGTYLHKIISVPKVATPQEAINFLAAEVKDFLIDSGCPVSSVLELTLEDLEEQVKIVLEYIIM